ncbi:MAG: GntR family transcriptional regulator [Streptosporangiaceae bacterium]
MARPPRPDQLVDLLRRAIRERVLLPGQPLNQDELARKFGVSRIPLREALRTLVGEGLVIMQPGAGAVVIELHPDELVELFELRLALEPPLAAAAVNKVSPADLAELEAVVAQMELHAESDVNLWATQHHGFHRRILEMAGRRHTLRLVTQVMSMVEPYSRLHTTLVGAREHTRAEHLPLLRALARGDADAVRELTVVSITAAAARLEAAARDDGDRDPLAVLLDHPS